MLRTTRRTVPACGCRTPLRAVPRGATLRPMLQAARLTPLLILAAAGLGCAAVETRIHLAAPNDAAWVVEDEDGGRVCALPCTVELEESERVTVAAPTEHEFLVQQDALGPGEFTARCAARRAPATEPGGRVSYPGHRRRRAGVVESDDDDHPPVLAGVGCRGIALARSRRGHRPRPRPPRGALAGAPSATP